MAKTLAQEIRDLDPTLVDVCKIIDTLAHRHRYDEIFQMLLDDILREHLFPGPVEPPQLYPRKIGEKEEELFGVLVRESIMYYRQHSGLRQSLFGINDWVDPLGDIYMAITGTWKSKHLGQFFTPHEVCNMMTMMVGRDHMAENRVCMLHDPCSGSGRMMLSAAYQMLSKKQMNYACSSDLDPICCKMTVVNKILNGVVGEVVCMNSLSGPRSHDWAMRIMPLQYIISELDPVRTFAFYTGLMRENMMTDKFHYVAMPIPASETYVYRAFETMEKEGKERAAAELQRQHEEHRKRLVKQAEKDALGTLFQDRTEDMAIVVKDDEKKPKAARPKKTGGSSGATQSSLF